MRFLSTLAIGMMVWVLGALVWAQESQEALATTEHKRWRCPRRRLLRKPAL
jgi:hypothetical protein